MPLTRREMLEHLALGTGTLVLAPSLVACGGGTPVPAAVPAEPAADPRLAVPRARPAAWDPITYNRDRGNAGAIPATYLPDVNGPDGAVKHLGKHLPFVPNVDRALVPAGLLPLMWGDTAKGYAAHPNAVRGEKNNFEGHWYNWIRVRKATDADAEEVESTFSEWPLAAASDNGKYAAMGGGDVAGNDGKDTIYLVALPSDVRPGDVVRIHGHCLTHGEYVDFVTV